MSPLSLLATRRFWPLLVAQVTSALHDHLFKNALAVAIIWGSLGSPGSGDSALLVTLAGGVFIVPFGLLSALGGQIADKFPRHLIVRAVKAADLAIVGLAGAALITGALPLALVALFALGASSALFAPAKMALLPQSLAREELVAGNALFNAGLFLAILAGTALGTVLMAAPGGAWAVGALLIALAATGAASAWLIPPAPAPEPGLRIRWEPLGATRSVLCQAFTEAPGVRLAIVGVAWFYFAGGVFLTQLPAFTQDALGGGPAVLALFLTLFSVGIVVGGLLNHWLLAGRVEATWVPLAAIGVAAFTWDLASSAPSVVRVAVDLTGLALCGGLFVVPLNAIIQARAPEACRARVLAASAIASAAAGVAATGLAAGLLFLGLTVPQIFAVLAALGAVVALATCACLPAFLLKSLLQAALKLLYRVEVRGMENLDAAGPRVVIVANHVSYLDAALLAAFLPGRPMFAVNSAVATWWWVRPWASLVRFFPLDPGNPFAIKALIKAVAGGERCVIFPEGRLTETGTLMKVYEGPGMVADRAGAPVVPVRLDGVQYTPLATRLAGRVPRRWFPKITMTVLPPRPMGVESCLRGRERRAAAGLALYDLMEGMMYATWPRPPHLWAALLDARRLHGAKTAIAEDVARRPLTYGALVTRAMALAQALKGCAGGPVGLLLPTSSAALVAFFALQATGRPAAMLNFSAGPAAVLAACTAARVSTVLTARAFIERAHLAPLIAALEQSGLAVLYLEDIAKRIGPIAKLRVALTPPRALAKAAEPGGVAVVLFTSGSEGAPKGVALTHRNILANIAQLSCRVDFTPQDIVFNALPTFHAFGLTAGTLLPVLSGVRTFLYPSPLHYRIVPEMIYSTNATIMFGTDTFLAGYARSANPYDFYRVRYIFSGAERVRESTRAAYADRFGVRILEGYGATEAAPVIAVNSAMHHRAGTVGRLLPGMEAHLEVVPGVAEGARLLVRGENIMAGYYRTSAPGVLERPDGGWHDTGDIVAVDREGYITIAGRAKRFAKVAGEMVSLAAVEALAAAAAPGAGHAVVAVADAKKGQRLILATTDRALTRAALSALAAERGASPLIVPAEVVVVEALPLLSSGKVDYPALERAIAEPHAGV